MPKQYLLKRFLVRLFNTPSLPNAMRRSASSALFRLERNRLVDAGRNNVLSYAGASLSHVAVAFDGDNNRIEIAPGAMLENVSIRVKGQGHRLTIGERCVLQHARFSFEDRDCTIAVGRHTTLEGGALAVVEPGSSIVIGEDCMCSHDIDIRTSDSHSLLDAATGARLNPPGDVRIGAHVWLGAYVHILKGVTIGANAVIGLRAVVTRDIPANALALGMPARVVKTGVTWDRERHAATATAPTSDLG